jgi:rare lipoprotein A
MSALMAVQQSVPVTRAVIRSAGISLLPGYFLYFCRLTICKKLKDMLQRTCILLFTLLFFSGLKAGNGTQYGKATYYGGKHYHRKTASGERYHGDSLTAAHRSLPFGTFVRVTNLENKKSVIVRINDRGPYGKGKIIDLSLAAAKEIDILKAGVVKVKLEILGKEKKPCLPASHRRKAIPQDTEKKETAPEKPSSDTCRGYGVQTGAFRDLNNALAAQEKLKKLGFKTAIDTLNLKNGMMYRLYAGPCKTRAEAMAILKKLKEQSIYGFVISF